MPKWFPAILALLCASAWGQVAQPLLQPHYSFVDQAGFPCSQCLLYSYQAGTTTPQPTYKDSGEIGENGNPIILDQAGGAIIWMGTVTPYKFILTDSQGNTIWTVDNVVGGYLPLIGGTLTGALSGTSASFSISVTAPNFFGNATTASALEATPTQCATGPYLYATGIQASGNANCRQVAYGDISGTPTIYYQTVQEAGTPLAQQPALNFDGTVVAANGASKTTVGLPATGPGAGAVTWPSSVTLDAQGRVTALASNTYTGASGYQAIGAGLKLVWAQGATQSVSGSTQTVTMPSAGCSAVLSVMVGTVNENGGVPTDTAMAFFQEVSHTVSSVVVFMMRNADHAYDPAAPTVWMICH